MADQEARQAAVTKAALIVKADTSGFVTRKATPAEQWYTIRSTPLQKGAKR